MPPPSTHDTSPQRTRTDHDGSAGEFTCTTEFTGATTLDIDHVDVLQRLQGVFPGGVADLHCRFTMDDALISRLVSEP